VCVCVCVCMCVCVCCWCLAGTFIPEECSELGQNRRRSLPKAVAKTLDQNEAFTVNNKREVDFDVGDTKSSHNVRALPSPAITLTPKCKG
jgi:hypothetical protein